MHRAGLVHAPQRADSPRKGRRKRTTPRPLVTLHGLRHTFVSTLLARGGKLIDVARVAGHDDPVITAKVYGHPLHNDQASYLADLFDETKGGSATDLAADPAANTPTSQMRHLTLIRT